MSQELETVHSTDLKPEEVVQAESTLAHVHQILLRTIGEAHARAFLRQHLEGETAKKAATEAGVGRTSTSTIIKRRADKIRQALKRIDLLPRCFQKLGAADERSGQKTDKAGHRALFSELGPGEATSPKMS